MRPTATLIAVILALFDGSGASALIRADRSPEAGSQPECTWSHEFNLPGFDNRVLTSVVWNDGSGPTLYVGGEFQHHGKKPIPFAARWNGLEWEPLVHPNGIGVNGPVRQLVVYDDGSGEALYAGGDFLTAGGEIVNGVARWDGRWWSPLLGHSGVGLDDGSFAAMTVHDFGYGDELVVGGDFETAGGAPVNNITLWNADRWRALTWFGGYGIDDEITSMTVAMGRLFITHRVVQGYGSHTALSFWDQAWVPVDGFNATSGRISLAAFDDGTGEALYVTEENDWGDVSRWNGAEWSPVVDSAGRELREILGYSSVGPFITSLVATDLGDGPALYLGGIYCWRFDGQNCIDSMFIARWGGDWEVITDEAEGLVAGATVATMTAIDDRSGQSLIVGGRDLADGATVLGAVGRWDRTSWSAFGRGEGNGMAGGRFPAIVSMTSFDEGAGPSLFAAGSFTTAGHTAAVGIARWRDGEWSALVDDRGNGACAELGCKAPVKLVSLDDDLGPALHAVATVQCSERYTSIDVARWTGTNWSRRGGTGCFYNYVNDIAVFDDGAGPAIYGCGLFASWNEAVMKFSGRSWMRIPGSGGYPPSGEARALEGWNHGAGEGLYVAGDFTEMGGLVVNGFVRWDGERWSVPEGPPGVRLIWGGQVEDMIVFDDGEGEALYVGGGDLTAGPPSTGVVKWDGVRWRTLNDSAGKLPGNVAAFAVFDDGGGPKLYAATNLQLWPEGFLSTVSRWDGDRWTVVGSWSSPRDEWRYLYTLFAHDDDNGASLYLGGRFKEFTGVLANGIARFDCPRPAYGNDAVRRSGRQVSP